MSPLTEPTRLVLARTPQPLDADAEAYVNLVERADGQRIEDPVRFAINNFVIGCKADGIWTAIKASCILAGARTLNGALVPLVGAAPTNVGPFVAGDYNRKTGLIGNASTKYLNTSYSDGSVGQNNISISVYQSTARTSSNIEALMGTLITSPSFLATLLQARSSSSEVVGYCSSSNDNGPFAGNIETAKFIGVSRSLSTSYTFRTNSVNTSFTQASAAATGINFYVFARNLNGTAHIPTNARIAFYHAGESLNLALLDARVTTLINAFATAIP